MVPCNTKHSPNSKKGVKHLIEGFYNCNVVCHRNKGE